MPSILPGAGLAPAWGQPDPTHLSAAVRKMLLVLREGRTRGEEEEVKGKYTSIPANEGGQEQRLLGGRKKKGTMRQGQEQKVSSRNKTCKCERCISLKAIIFCQHVGSTSSLLLVQVFSESYSSHNRFRLVALRAPLLFLPKVPSMLSFSFFTSPALISFSLLLLLMNCLVFCLFFFFLLLHIFGAPLLLGELG